MLSCVEFIRKSLELHLFFARIMKEHAFFLEVGLLQKNSDLICQADTFRIEFTRLLSETISLSNGSISPNVLLSGEVVTPYTLKTEMFSTCYTGIPLQTNLTLAEANLMGSNMMKCNPIPEQRVSMLNQKALRLISAIVKFKTKLLSDVSSCKIYIFYYPLIIEHILEEAKLYFVSVQKLQNRQDIYSESEILEQELFWNNRVAEHSKVLSGLLDPRESELITTMNKFGDDFLKLVEETEKAMNNSAMIPKVTYDSLIATEVVKDFSVKGVQGLIECKIKSIIIPLAADHVLRETNHYLNLLRYFEKII